MQVRHICAPRSPARCAQHSGDTCLMWILTSSCQIFLYLSQLAFFFPLEFQPAPSEALPVHTVIQAGRTTPLAQHRVTYVPSEPAPADTTASAPVPGFQQTAQAQCSWDGGGHHQRLEPTTALWRNYPLTGDMNCRSTPGLDQNPISRSNTAQLDGFFFNSTSICLHTERRHFTCSRLKATRSSFSNHAGPFTTYERGHAATEAPGYQKHQSGVCRSQKAARSEVSCQTCWGTPPHTPRPFLPF